MSSHSARHIKAHADKIDLMKVELLKHIAIIRAEEGRINYYLYQDNENHAHFMLYENWQTHMTNQYLADYMAVTEGAVAEFTLNEITAIS